VTQKAHDQAGANAKLTSRIDHGAMQAADNRGECNPPRGVPLRVEKHLDMPDIVVTRASEIRPGEIVKVLLGDEHGHALIVDVEEILKAIELISLAQRLDRSVG
jgi:hypothetical protein